VPIAFTLIGWGLRSLAPDAAGALALLHDVRLPLWPMSRLFDDAAAGRHWLYLPLAAILSNALIYAIVGVLAAWGRTAMAAFVAALAVAIAVPLAAQQGFGTSIAGVAIAAAFSVTGLLLHRRARPGAS
jgi:hypothetical protein